MKVRIRLFGALSEQAGLAEERANGSSSTVRDFEEERHVPIGSKLAALRSAFEAAGITMLPDESGEPIGIARQATPG